MATVRASPIHGSGLFALRDLAAGRRIGVYGGRRYEPDADREWDLRLRRRQRTRQLDNGRYQARVAITSMHPNKTCAQRFLDLESFDSQEDAVEHSRQAGMHWVNATDSLTCEPIMQHARAGFVMHGLKTFEAPSPSASGRYKPTASGSGAQSWPNLGQS